MVERREAKNISADKGPWMWRNARLAEEGASSIGALEIGFYVDTWLAPLEGSAGPFRFIDPLYDQLPSELYINGDLNAPAMCLMGRVEQYAHSDEPSYDYVDDTWKQTDPDVYHGGDASDEVAALVSIATGRRVRSAGIIRVFELGQDPRGAPHQQRKSTPYSPFPPHYLRVLPYAWRRTHGESLRALELIELYSSLSSLEAAALIRAARTYQEALWIAEDDPRQAWLRLVSAAEVVAQLAPDLPAGARLKRAFPETEPSMIVKRLLETGDDELIEWAARRLADQGRSTRKFLDFFQRYQPPQPPRRPTTQGARVDWSKLRKQLRRIYEYRSSDLHAGIPFPASMCEVPWKTPRKLAYEVAHEVRGGKQDAPILLHVFEYIVRVAIQKWWRSTGRANRRLRA